MAIDVLTLDTWAAMVDPLSSILTRASIRACGVTSLGHSFGSCAEATVRNRVTAMNCVRRLPRHDGERATQLPELSHLHRTLVGPNRLPLVDL